MILDDWTPDMVVGVDFGMTCTGVAYSEAPDWGEPKPLQHWPGKIISELANKVPTILGYLENSRDVKSWGFLCDIDKESDLDYRQFFKLSLDPEYKDGSDNAPTAAEARKWFQDYLRCIHSHIDRFFGESYPQWSSMKVEFVFSVPTSWNNPSMIAELEKLMIGAGFGKGGPNHRVHVGLTEAEAAAVYAAKQHYQRNDIVLVCDAGGGTTDVNVLKLDSNRGEATRLKQLSWVEGQAIGSALIDFRFHKLITDRLSTIRDRLSRDPDEIADKMLKGRFEKFKCSFGSAAMDFPTFALQVGGLGPGSSFPHLGIIDGEMILTREELQQFFDSQVNAMLALIDGQLQRMEINHPTEQIAYLVLSGGLGSSPYLRKRLKEHYEEGPGRNRSNAHQMRILLSPEPQLAVVQGLVMDRKEANHGNVVFDERCCRVSYGMLCREPYDPTIHMGEDVYFDPRDKKKWALHQIDWFVEQGNTVPSKGIAKPYQLKLGLGQSNKSWKTQIVMSTLPAEQRPNSLKNAGNAVKNVCDVDAELDGVDMKLKNRHWYNRGPKYLRAEFDIKTVIGPADLKFQVWSKGGVCSKNHDSIDVKWDPPRSGSSAAVEDMSAMYLLKGTVKSNCCMSLLQADHSQFERKQATC